MRWTAIVASTLALASGACAEGSADPDPNGAGVDATPNALADAARADATGQGPDAATPSGADAGADATPGSIDAATADAAPRPADAMPGPPDAGGGVITGGPCISGASGATAYRVRWLDGGSTAYVGYEVNGLPDTSRDHTASYGYTIGFTPSFVDPFLGEGGLQLNSSNFVDIELSTVGLSAIDSATLSLYGRSYNTTTSGSFDWQTFDGAGAAPTNLVSNVAPYQWYSADMTTEISPGDDGVLLRIYAGPSSGSLVVNRIEICMQAR